MDGDAGVQAEEEMGSFRRPTAAAGPGKDATTAELAHALEETPKWVPVPVVVAKQAAPTTAPVSNLSVISIEDAAAIKIQSVFRSCLVCCIDSKSWSA
jgi:hypothetical protein